MLFFLIVGLLLGAIAVVFSLQNIVTITVTFLAWKITGSLSLILLLAVTAGVLISILVTLPEFFKHYVKIGSLRKQNKKLQEDVENYKKMIQVQPLTKPTVAAERDMSTDAAMLP